MSSSSLTAVRDDSRVNRSGPRAGGPRSRRAFSAQEKFKHLTAYEAAVEAGRGGGYLRENGLYSSLISEWRRVRDAGVLTGKSTGDKIGKLSAEQVEIARLRRQLDVAERRLATTQVALAIMGKAHELLEEISKSSRDDAQRDAR